MRAVGAVRACGVSGEGGGGWAGLEPVKHCFSWQGQWRTSASGESVDGVGGVRHGLEPVKHCFSWQGRWKEGKCERWGGGWAWTGSLYWSP